MKRFLIMLTISLGFLQIRAQTTEDSVKATVNKLFLAMKNADTAALRSCFSGTMVLQTVNQNKDGKTTVLNEPANGFIASVSQLKSGEPDEQIVYEAIRIDGPLAMVWTPYKFYYKGKFSHCGVNSFQLVKLEGEWKLQYIIDTRRREGCQ